MALEADVTAAIQQLADRLADEAIGSIDHAVNAKAIALRSPLVIDKLRATLSNGHRLKDIVALTSFGASLFDFRLRFHFDTDNIIDLPTGDFIVSVELPTKSVKRIMDPSSAVSPSTAPVPFPLAVPSRASEYRTPMTELTNRFNRTQAFLRNLPLDQVNAQLRRQGYNQLARSAGETRTTWESVSQVIVATDIKSTVDTYIVTEEGGSDFQDDVQDETIADIETVVREDSVRDDVYV